MNLPDSIEDISPNETITVSDIGELYDTIIKDILEYTDEDMEEFDVYELDNKRNAIRVTLFGPEKFHNNRVKNLHDRMDRVGEDQATVESIQINYIAKDTPDGVIYAIVDNSEEISEFIVNSNGHNES